MALGQSKQSASLLVQNILDMWQAVLGAYAKAEQPSEDALMNARMAYLLRAGDVNVSFGNVKLWTPPLTADEGYTKEMAHGS